MTDRGEIDGHDGADLNKVLENAQAHRVPTVMCSWGIVSVRRRLTGQWAHLLMFFDRDTLIPFFIYEFEDETTLKAMAARLVKTKHFSDGVREEFGV